MNKIKKLNEEFEKLLEDQLWEMSNLHQKDTGLPVVIYISPKNANHGPRIKFMNNYTNKYQPNELIPLTIEDDPKIPINKRIKIKEKDLQKIKDWVKLNKQSLLDYWNEKITTKEVINLLIPIQY